MKKILALILAVFMIGSCMLVLSSCNKDKDDGGEGESLSGIFSFTVEGTKVELGKNATKTLKALGDAKGVKELGNCGGRGTQRRYDFGDFYLYTLEESDGEETVDQIDFKSDNVTTSKGIRIGDAKSLVTEKYGKATSGDKDALIYTSGKLSLKFTLDDSMVSAIEYICAE